MHEKWLRDICPLAVKSFSLVLGRYFPHSGSTNGTSEIDLFPGKFQLLRILLYSLLSMTILETSSASTLVLTLLWQLCYLETKNLSNYNLWAGPLSDSCSSLSTIFIYYGETSSLKTTSLRILRASTFFATTRDVVTLLILLFLSKPPFLITSPFFDNSLAPFYTFMSWICETLLIRTSTYVPANRLSTAINSVSLNFSFFIAFNFWSSFSSSYAAILTFSFSFASGLK